MQDYHKSSIAETFFILLFTILPSIFVLLKILFSTDATEYEIFKSGEFFLYGVSLLSSSYLVYNHFRIKKSDLNSMFSFLSIILIVLYSLAYMVLATTESPNVERIKFYSIISFVISIPLFYYSQVVSNKHSPDVGEQRRDEQQQIQNGLS